MKVGVWTVLALLGQGGLWPDLLGHVASLAFNTEPKGTHDVIVGGSVFAKEQGLLYTVRLM